MEQETLSLEIREQKGKGAARKIRAKGKLPGVLYGHGNNTSITVDPKIVRKTLLQEGGKNRVFSLSCPGLGDKKAMIKEYQVDPVSRKLLHVDLLEILATEKITIMVTLDFTGKPIGVTEDGGVMSITERDIEVNCFPDKIPDSIAIDVTNLKIGDSVHLDEVSLPEGVEKVSQTNPTLVTVVPPTKEEELAPALAEGAEPEVIGEKKAEEGEEGAEKAAAAPADDKKEDKKDKKDKK